MHSKIRLLYITNQICASAGLERVLSIKARILAEQYNYEVHIITLNQGDTELFYDFGKEIKYHDLEVLGNPIKYLKEYVFNMRVKVKEINPDIISVCDDGLKGFFLPIILNKPCPMVYERHVSREIENTSDKFIFFKWIKNKIKYNLMYFGGKKYDKFVLLTNGNLKEWPLKNTVVINNPLTFDSKVVKSHLNKKIVLAVGRQSYQKGYDRLLSAWKIINKSNPKWELHIYGKKDPDLELETLAKEYNISKSVRFFNPLKNIGLAYQMASIFALSSRFEGFGMVLTEAMIHGVPCVAFDCPYGPSDIIVDSKTGILVENGDIESFAGAVISLIENEEKRVKMGLMAIKTIAKYDIENIMPIWDNLLTKLVKND